MEQQSQIKPQITAKQMLAKLDEMYDKEEALLNQIKNLELELQQIKQDKEMIQTMYMYQSNKEALKKKEVKWTSFVSRRQ